jgi:DNA (cytosine-5)-methyltransferase 1
MSAERNKGELRCLSLFSGVGGLDLGFLRNGIKIVGAWDADPDACDTYEANLGVRPETKDINHLRHAVLPACEIVLAGPPCQGFSSLAGRGRQDRRNRLILLAARLIARIRPDAFVIENVLGLRWRSNGAFIRKVRKILQAADLKAEIVELDCSKLGLPQRRRRILVVGGKGKVGSRVVQSVRKLANSVWPTMTVADALLRGPSLVGLKNHEPRRHTLQWYSGVIRKIGAGQKLCDTRLGRASVHSWDIPEVFGETTEKQRLILRFIAQLRRQRKKRRYKVIGDGRPVTLLQLSCGTSIPILPLRAALRRLASAGYVVLESPGRVDITRRFNGRFKRLPLHGVSPAVLADFGSARTVLHPTDSRGLTVRECARLQGFEDDFVFMGTKSKQYQLVANAFPPAVSFKLAAAVLDTLHERLSKQTTRRRLALIS